MILKTLSSFRGFISHGQTLLKFGRSTLYRRPEEEGISNETHYSDLSNADLDRLVQEIKIMHPNDGEV